MRISYENNRVYFMPEMDGRPTFYYTTPLFSPSMAEKKLDYLLMEYQKRERFKPEEVTKTKSQLEERISALVFELGTYNHYIPPDY